MAFSSYPIIIIVVIAAVSIIIRLIISKKRTEALEKNAKIFGLSFQKKPVEDILSQLKSFDLFSQGGSKKIKNLIKGRYSRIKWNVFDYIINKYHTTSQGSKRLTYFVAYTKLDKDLPKFILSTENFATKITSALGFGSKYKDIDFSNYKPFSERYYLRGNDETAIRKLFDSKLLNFFASSGFNMNLETNNTQIIIYSSKRIKPQNLKSFLDLISNIVKQFQDDY
jgi:hypothetical protein